MAKGGDEDLGRREGTQDASHVIGAKEGLKGGRRGLGWTRGGMYLACRYTKDHKCPKWDLESRLEIFYTHFVIGLSYGAGNAL